MKKLLSTILIAILLLSSLSMFACGSKNGVVEDTDVVLINVEGLTEYDLNNGMSKKGQDLIKDKEDLSYRLVSIATGSVFTFNSSIIPLDQIHKEYYEVRVIDNETATVIYTGKFDFHDINNDGLVWCEMSAYTVGAVRTDAPSDITYEYVEEDFCEGDMIVCQPTSPRYWRFAYYAIMPFHSKEYYLEYTNAATMFEITYVRKAVYDRQSWNFNPDTMEHLDGVYAEPRSVINVRYFGCGGNVSSTGAQLNVAQSLTFRMVDILEKFDAIGRPNQGFGNYWYFVGTCHDKGNPYKVTYFLQYIDLYE